MFWAVINSSGSQHSSAENVLISLKLAAGPCFVGPVFIKLWSDHFKLNKLENSSKWSQWFSSKMGFNGREWSQRPCSASNFIKDLSGSQAAKSIISPFFWRFVGAKWWCKLQIYFSLRCFISKIKFCFNRKIFFLMIFLASWFPERSYMKMLAEQEGSILFIVSIIYCYIEIAEPEIARKIACTSQLEHMTWADQKSH